MSEVKSKKADKTAGSSNGTITKADTGSKKKGRVCPITREEFAQYAKPVEVKIGDGVTTADPKEFSTGSLGWFINGKTVLTVGDKRVEVQIGMNLTIIGSKELPKDEE